MVVSLKNRKNTKIVRYSNGESRLYHHGSNTCTIDPVKNEVKIDLCGWDTVTTRGKIHAFLYAEGVDISIGRRQGVTWATSRRTSDNIDLSRAQTARFTLDTLNLI